MQGYLDGNERIIWFSDFLLKSLFYQLLPVLSFSWSLRQTRPWGTVWPLSVGLSCLGCLQLPSPAPSPRTAVRAPRQLQVSLASSGPYGSWSQIWIPSTWRTLYFPPGHIWDLQAICLHKGALQGGITKAPGLQPQLSVDLRPVGREQTSVSLWGQLWTLWGCADTFRVRKGGTSGCASEYVFWFPTLIYLD